MTAAQRRTKNKDRNKGHVMVFKSYNVTFDWKCSLDLLFHHPYSYKVNARNGNKRLIKYLNMKARAEHMKSVGLKPKPVKTIRQMYLESKTTK